MVEGERSTVTDVDSGVALGTVLGPLLFLAFISDLPEVVSSPVRILYFAASTKWRTQQLYKTTCQHYNNGSPTGK